ncbi:cryptic protein-like [Dendrobates tinctorius]|uniref:cryptic protein-like n=1 Tax=Dendrobates tinctorius TaxID=92724 RepID=UPI003CC9876F
MGCSRLFYYLAFQLLIAGHLGIAFQNGTMTMARSALLLETYLEKPMRDTNHTGIRKHKSTGETIPFIGLTKTSSLDKHCCQNGGTCMLGSFCACPKHFTGRHCEFDLRKRYCGSVAHKHWLPKRCALCRCIHGVMYCFPSGACESNEYKEEIRMVQSKGRAKSSCPIVMLILTAVSIGLMMLPIEATLPNFEFIGAIEKFGTFVTKRFYSS